MVSGAGEVLDSWAILDMDSWSYIEPSWALGTSWAYLGLLGFGLLGISWGRLGSSWSHLEASKANRKRKGEKAKSIDFLKVVERFWPLGGLLGRLLGT